MKKIIIGMLVFITLVLGAIIIRDIIVLNKDRSKECCSCCDGSQEVCMAMCCPCTKTIILPDKY